MSEIEYMLEKETQKLITEKYGKKISNVSIQYNYLPRDDIHFFNVLWYVNGRKFAGGNQLTPDDMIDIAAAGLKDNHISNTYHWIDKSLGVNQ